MTDKR
jgi:hypothetical protein